MPNLLDYLDSAESHTRFAMGQLRQGAGDIDCAVGFEPSFSEKLRALSLQLWTMESLVRDVNAAIASLYTEVRISP